jgi:multidrug resistance efflux pump
MTKRTRHILRSALKSRVAVLLFIPATVVISLSCQSRSGSNETDARGIIIVNAPAAGMVRRVLVREGMAVNEGAALVEIAVESVATQTPQTPPAEREDPVARAGRNIGATEKEIEAARAEVVRHEVEVQRLTPLVASGGAPQAQLDGARAEYERAQQRLQRAQAAAQAAQAGLVAARQQSRNSTATTTTAPAEQMVTARASSAGTVSAISAQVGQRVTAGQPLATLRAERR